MKKLIGRVYKHFLQVFAVNSEKGTEKGEFYTTASIVELISELVES